MSGRLRRWFGAAAALVCLTLVPADARAGEFTVTWTPTDGPVEINRMHSWIVHLADADGQPVIGATIDVAGGMPEHDHGLPTAPRITADLGGGDYRLDGLRFHMRGRWEIAFTIEAGASRETVVVVFDL